MSVPVVRLLVVLVAVVSGVALAAGISTKKLVVVDRSAAGAPIKITFGSSDAPGGVLSPPDGMFASVTLVFDDTSVSYGASSGAFDGTRGWRVSAPRSAVYLDRATPDASVGIGKLAVKVGRSLKGVLWLPSLPASPTTLRGLAITYGATPTRCSHLTCSAKTAGSTVKVVCRNGAPDDDCTIVSTTTTSSTTSSTTTTLVPAVCGNGILEAGERCDGGPYCAATCTPAPPSCCALPDQCVAAPPFILYFNLSQYCMSAPGYAGSVPMSGGVCHGDGTCTVEPIPTTSLCCQVAGSCSDGTASTTQELWSFRNLCEGAQSGQTRYPATCVAGACTPQ